MFLVLFWLVANMSVIKFANLYYVLMSSLYPSFLHTALLPYGPHK